MKSKLSIVIPAYNEEAFIVELLRLVKAVKTEELGFEKEIIVVDDCSKDQTFALASSIDGVRCLKQAVNAGKGSAVQRGIRECSGDFVLVQDADLEYDPADYIPMLRCLSEAHGKAAIYGSRTLGQRQRENSFTLFPGRHPSQSLGPWIAGVVLTLWTFLLYRNWVSDTLTAYKIYPTSVIRGFQIKTKGFETDHEITAKLIRSGVSIKEVPIAYSPRTKEEGKKISWKDGFIALWTLLRFRFGA